MELTLKSPLTVTVLRNDGLGVSLVSAHPFPRDRTLSVKDSEGNEARVNVYQSRRSVDGNWVGFGTIYEGWLEEQTPTPMPVPLRSVDRSQIEVSVRSELLLGLEGRTVDLSQNGLQLEVAQPMDVGENVEVTLDLEDGQGPLELWASIRWCQVGELSRVGLQFIGATVSERARLEDYLVWHGLTLSQTSRSRTRCECTVFNDVFLKDVFRQEGDLVVRLVLESSMIEQSFAEPAVAKVGKRESRIKRVTRKPLGSSRFFYSFIDKRGQTVLAFVAGLPEVKICLV